MKKKLIIKPKMVAVYLITILLSVVYIIVGHKLAIEGLTAFDGAQDTPISYKAKVVQIMSKERQVALEGVDGDDGGVNVILYSQNFKRRKKRRNGYRLAANRSPLSHSNEGSRSRR